ncbi:MAG: right-handed parallel beta-helix repeat-containing protein, partial [Elusimicrobiota bacterium]
HSGTSPTQAEIINLTRNLLVTAYDTTAVGYVVFETTATVDIDWCEFSYLGENATDKYGVTAKTTTGSCNVQNCALHDFEDCGFYTTGSASDNITFSNNVTYGLASLAGDNVSIVATSGTAITLDNNVVMYSAYSSGRGYCIGDVGITFTNNIVTGTRSYGMLISESKVLSGTFSGNTSHSCATAGMNVANAKVGTISSTTIWRCAGGYAGIYMSTLSNIIFDGVTLFGNETGSLQFGGNVNLVFKNVVSNGDTTFATADGVKFSSTALNADILFENCDFGTASGIKTAHTNDINVNAVCYVTFTLINTILASPTEVANQANMFSGSYIKSQKHDQTAGLHKAWFPNGTMSIDTAIFDVTPSTRMTPIDAAEKLELPVAKFAVVNGATATVSVKVRESVVGDGTDYNGNRARLILKKNIAAGITADTVLATATVASEGAWETLSGTTTAPTDDAVLECAVDCDGTTGWLNVDTSGVT